MLSTSFLSMLVLLSGIREASTSKLPVIDLGYEIHEAATQDTNGLYTWSNIRFAQAPTGELRWQPPHAPVLNRSYTQDGSGRAVACPQSRPLWELELSSAIPNDTFYANFTVPPESEDCLFLDVYVPSQVWQNRHRKKVPVLFWIFGGGFVQGTKTTEGHPSGLIQESGNDMVVVMINYRLGALGWMAGPSFESNPATSSMNSNSSAASGTANVGLLDQKFALEWVQRHIHLFGGDAEHVTAMGESAGGASLMHHITAFAGGPTGDGKYVSLGFQQAILQSPAWYQMNSNQVQEQTYNAFLNATGCDSLACLRRLPEQDVIAANNKTIYFAQPGNYVFGPVPDGSFVPAYPGELLRKGKFARQVRIMAGHNVDEAKYYAPPGVRNSSVFNDFISQLIPFSFPQVQSYVEDTLYPQSAYRSNQDRAAQVESDGFFSCNTRYLATGFGGKTFNYMFAYDDAIHGNDVPYTFFRKNHSAGNAQVAAQLQGYIVSFTKGGDPGFPVYGHNATLRVVNDTAPRDIVDPTANERCDWWQLALYQ